MKILFAFLLLPIFSLSQTVHIKDGQIVYEGKANTYGISATETYTRAENVLASLVKKAEALKDSGQQNNTIRSRGEIKLKTPHPIIRKVLYTIELSPIEGGYHYRIDSVYVKEQRRGGKAKLSSSKDLLELIEEGGPPAIGIEKILNEADMRFQKLLTELRSRIIAGR